MLAVKRQQIILEYLDTHKAATTKLLSELTGASLATLRRDLNHMAQQGLLKKTHGGAQAVPIETDPPKHDCPSLDYDPYLSFKNALAKKAADLIVSGDIIFIGAGMTCNLLCRYINENHPEKLTAVHTHGPEKSRCFAVGGSQTAENIDGHGEKTDKYYYKYFGKNPVSEPDYK